MTFPLKPVYVRIKEWFTGMDKQNDFINEVIMVGHLTFAIGTNLFNVLLYQTEYIKMTSYMLA